MKVYYNESCNICKAEINLYKKQNIEEIEWVDFTNNIKDILHPDFTTKKGGTGLGLSIVNKIINDNNGKVKISGKMIKLEIATKIWLRIGDDKALLKLAKAKNNEIYKINNPMLNGAEVEVKKNFIFDKDLNIIRTEDYTNTKLVPFQND